MVASNCLTYGLDRARTQAEALGHQLEPFRATYVPAIVTARCVVCRRSVWAGRRETFGPAIECRCEELARCRR